MVGRSPESGELTTQRLKHGMHMPKREKRVRGDEGGAHRRMKQTSMKQDGGGGGRPRRSSSAKHEQMPGKAMGNGD